MSGPDLDPTGQFTELLSLGGVRVDWHGPADEPVVTVTLARPEVRNAQTPATWRTLAAVGDHLPSTTRIVVLRGDGPGFSAGLDLRMFGAGIPGEAGLAAIAALPEAEADATIAGFQRAFRWWRECDAVTVAAVHGAAVGAGTQLALACDLILCADDARFAIREPSLGLVPDLGGTWALVRAVGHARALEIALTGRWVEAPEARALGLALTPRAGGTLAEQVDALVAELLAVPEAAARATRRLLRAAGSRTPVEQLSAERAEQVQLLRALAASAG